MTIFKIYSYDNDIVIDIDNKPKNNNLRSFCISKEDNESWKLFIMSSVRFHCINCNNGSFAVSLQTPKMKLSHNVMSKNEDYGFGCPLYTYQLAIKKPFFFISLSLSLSLSNIQTNQQAFSLFSLTQTK